MKEISALRQEIDELRRCISRLSTAALHINTSLDLQAVLVAIIDNAREAFGAVYGLINLVNEAGQAEDLVSAGLTPEEHKQLTLWPDGPKLFEFFRDLRGVLSFSDLPPDTYALAATSGLLHAKTFLSTPLHHRGKYVGNFFLMGKKDGVEFTSKDEEMLVLFSSLAATAIANARTLRSEQWARTDLEALVDTVPIGVMVFDAQAGRAVLSNKVARRLVEELVVPDCSLEQLLEDLMCMRANGQVLPLSELTLAHQAGNADLVRGEEIELSAHNGRGVRVLLNATPIRSTDDTIVSMVVTIQDLEPLTKLERSQAEFISLVSHELRAPLASIKGSSTTILGAPKVLEYAEIVQFVRIINAQADHMRDLISDLLDIGRIDTGTLSVESEPWNLVDIVERARIMFQSGSRGHTVIVDLASRLPRVMVDSLRIVQVLNNLLENAAEHSPDRTPIRVTAKHTGTHVAVSVEDQGMGIPPERLTHLFRRYTAASEDQKPTLRGTGLGLAICKGLVEAQGGRIWANSDGVGRGAEIIFTIPVAEETDSNVLRRSADTSAGSSRFNSEPARILVVEDDPNMLRLVRDTLRAAGFYTIAIVNHKDLSRIIKKEKPQLVLLDLMLPGTNGIALLDDVPELAELPVIFISGYGNENTIVQALDAGAVDYIVKPFSTSELTARIRATLRTHTKPEHFELGNLVIDYQEHRVTLSGRPVQLTAKEYELLRVLSIKPGHVLKFSTLIRAVWNNRAHAHPGLVRAIVLKLRRKLGKDPDEPDYIINVHGVGYRLAKPDEL